ncbi:hypothetical protein ScPMuIL_007885 [Solemya velum]
MVVNRALEAVARGEIESIKSIPDNELSKNKDDYGANCLHYAARIGNVDILEYLIKEKGLNETKRTNVGSTPAHDASATGNLEALQWLLGNSSCTVDDQDGTGATVLHLAARYGHGEMVAWLLDSTNCDLMKKTASGAIPLHFAVVGGRLHIVKQLVKEGPVSVNIQMDNGATPVYLSCQAGRLDILRDLADIAGASLKMRAFDGMSCLHTAAQGGHLQCVQYLIQEHKCNPNERDFDGATPLHFASSRGHYKLVEWLMKHGGAKVTLDNLGGSPLHNAAELGQNQCVRVLLKNGCSPHITDNCGLTAVELAEKCWKEECAKTIQDYIDQGLVDDPSSDSCSSVSSLSESDDEVDLNSDYERVPSTLNSDFERVPSTRLPPVFLSVPYKAPSFSGFGIKPVNGVATTNGSSHYLKGVDRVKSAAESPTKCTQSKETGECDRVSKELPDFQDFVENSHHNVVKQYEERIEPTRHESSNLTPAVGHTRQINKPDSMALELHPPDIAVKQSEGTNSEISSVVSSLSSTSLSADLPEQLLSQIRRHQKQRSDRNIETHFPKISDSPFSRRQQPPVQRPSPPKPMMDTTDADSDSMLDYRSELDSAEIPSDCHAHSNGVLSNGSKSASETNGLLNSSSSSQESVDSLPKRTAGPGPYTMSVIPPKVLNNAIASNTDLVSQLKEAAGGSALKRTKKPNEDGRTMVFAFGLPNQTAKNGSSIKEDEAPKPLILEGEYDPKNFLDKVPQVDESGREIPPWKQQVLARQLAEKTKEEDEAKKQLEEREARFKNVPAWKRAIIEKREAEAKAEREQAEKANQRKAARNAAWQKKTDKQS